LGKNLGHVRHYHWWRCKAQQIRFNIFQLNQTYLGKDSRLNIGPKVLLVKIWRIYLLGYRSGDCFTWQTKK
jgi:hypothetical protein